MSGQAIIHGHEAQPNQFPFMVSLRELLRTTSGIQSYNHFCGATSISGQWVISAAHCLHGEWLNTSTIRVFTGVHHFSKDGREYE